MSQTVSSPGGAQVSVPAATLRQLRAFVVSTNAALREQGLPEIEGDVAQVSLDELRFLVETINKFARTDAASGPRGMAARQVLRDVPEDVIYALYSPGK